MTKKLIYILICVLVVFAVAGTSVLFVFFSDKNVFEKNITLSKDDTVSEVLSVSLDGFYPGKSVEYTVNFDGTLKGLFKITITFSRSGETSLSDYITVDIQSGNEIKASKTLTDFLNDDTTVFVIDTADADESKLIFRYTMPVDTGNEAQNTKADFDIDLWIKPEK